MVFLLSVVLGSEERHIPALWRLLYPKGSTQSADMELSLTNHTVYGFGV